MADFNQDNGSIGDALDLGDYEGALVDRPNIVAGSHAHYNNAPGVHYNDGIESDSPHLQSNLRKTKSNEPTVVTASPRLMASNTAKANQFARRPSDDDFAKMSMLSMRGGGFVVPRGVGTTSNIDPDSKLPEIPETPYDLNQTNQRQSGAGTPVGSALSRTQSERHRRGPRHRTTHSPPHSNSNNGEDALDLPSQGAKTPSRIPSFRIPRNLRVLPQAHGGKQQYDYDNETDYSNGNKAQRDTYVDETLWNDEPSGESASSNTPQAEVAELANTGLAPTWSFSSNEGLDVSKPRSRASTLDRRHHKRTTIEIGIKSSPVMMIKRTPSGRRAPPPTCPPQRRLLASKRRSVSDLNIPLSLQQTLIQRAEAAATVSAPRQSIHFDESKQSLGRWLAKMLLGAKYGEPACHRIRRISREGVLEMITHSTTGSQRPPHISRVFFVGECGVGKHELVRNFRNIGAPGTSCQHQQSIDDPLNDIISRGTSFSDNSSDEIDPSQLVAFEYNDRLLLLDFLFADTEEEFVRHLIQRPPDLIVAVYSVCSSTSLDFCISVMDRLKNNACEIPLALVGNKCDLVVARTVSKQESRAVAKQYGITLLEVSALLGEKCPELLLGVLRQLTYKPSLPQQHESVTPQNSTGNKSNTIWSRLSKTFSK